MEPRLWGVFFVLAKGYDQTLLALSTRVPSFSKVLRKWIQTDLVTTNSIV